MSGRSTGPRLRATPLALALAVVGACASSRELRVAVEVEGADDAGRVEVVVHRSPTRRVPFVTCDPNYNILSGRVQCDPKPGAEKTERLAGKRGGLLLEFGPVPETRFGPGGYRVDRVTVRLPTETLEITEGRAPRRAGAPLEAGHVYCQSLERRTLFGGPDRPSSTPEHPVQVTLEDGWPRELVVRPLRLRLGERELVGALWEGLRAAHARAPAQEPTWSGWRWRRRADGSGQLEHGPSGALLRPGAGEEPGTIRIPPGARLSLPIKPSPSDGGGDPRREETLEVVVVAPSEAAALRGHWGLRSGYGDPREPVEASGGRIEENGWSIPMELWRALTERELHPPGLELELSAGGECGEPIPELDPVVCVRLARVGELPELLLLAAAYREDDTKVWATAWRLTAPEP